MPPHRLWKLQEINVILSRRFISTEKGQPPCFSKKLVSCYVYYGVARAGMTVLQSWPTFIYSMITFLGKIVGYSQYSITSGNRTICADPKSVHRMRLHPHPLVPLCHTWWMLISLACTHTGILGARSRSSGVAQKGCTQTHWTLPHIPPLPSLPRPKGTTTQIFLWG